MSQGAAITFNPTVAPTALTFLPPGTLHSFLDNRLFLTFSGPTYDIGPGSVRGKQLWNFALDDTGAIVSSQLTLQYVGQGYATCVGLGAGEDGLYFTDLYGEDGFNENGITSANIYRISVTTVSGAEDVPPSPPAPEKRRLLAVPNPTRGSTLVHFELSRGGPGRLGVYDVAGRLRREIQGEWNAGVNHAEWNGRDDSGAPMTPGVYFLKLDVAGESLTSRVVVGR
jgi:hypothetical protein